MLAISLEQAVAAIGLVLLIGSAVWFISKSRILLLVVTLVMWFAVLRWWYQW